MRHSSKDRTVYLKQCPRCGGDLFTSKDQYGNYIHCIQCGYMADIDLPRALEVTRPSDFRDNVA